MAVFGFTKTTIGKARRILEPPFVSGYVGAKFKDLSREVCSFDLCTPVEQLARCLHLSDLPACFGEEDTMF
jgi:hypothetical protein